MSTRLGLLKWLGSLPVKEGEIVFVINGEVGNKGELRFNFSVEGISIQISDATGLIWNVTQSARTNLPTSCDLSPFRFGISPSREAFQNKLQAVKIENAPGVPALPTWLNGASWNVTLLVIPGITAFRCKLPPLEFGPVKLPIIEADISLRDVAVDLASGSIAMAIRIHSARALGEVVINTESGELRLDSPSFWLSGDILIESSGFSAITLDRASFEVGAVKMEVRLTRDVMGSLICGPSSIELADARVEYENGNMRTQRFAIRAACQNVGLKADTFQLAQARFNKFELKACRLDLGLAHDLSVYRGALGFRSGTIKIEDVELAPTDTTTLELGDALDDDGWHPFDKLVFDLPTGEVSGASISILRAINSLSYTSGGLSLTNASQSGKVRISLNRQGTRTESGLQIYLPRVDMAVGSDKVTVTDIRLFRWEEHPLVSNHVIPVLTTRAINQIEFRIDKIEIHDLPPGEQAISFRSSQIGSLQGLAFLAKLVAGQDIDSTINQVIGVLDKIEASPSSVSIINDLLGLSGFGVDDYGLVVGTKGAKVSYRGDLSSDSALAFSVTPSFDSIAVFLDYHYRVPRVAIPPWEDKNERGILVRVDMNVELLPIVVKFGFSVETATKKIRVDRISISVALPDGADPKVQQAFAAAQQLILYYFNISGIMDSIVSALNLKIPVSLPSGWDPMNVKIEPESGAIDFALRAIEHDFARIS